MEFMKQPCHAFRKRVKSAREVEDERLSTKIAAIYAANYNCYGVSSARIDRDMVIAAFKMAVHMRKLAGCSDIANLIHHNSRISERNGYRTPSEIKEVWYNTGMDIRKSSKTKL
ncbi:hypothetical protein FACS1894167_14140 [Synergistales bacterium]|nr:hypothetical protein FACS1894167_14140 [Synergistales bacterium]